MITITTLGYAGRLGNQMFQYATLMSLANKTGFKPVIPARNLNMKPDGTYDLANKFWIEYKFLLNECFHLDIPFATDEELSIINKSYKEPHFHYDENLFKIEDNTGIDGYFQSYRYFEDIENDVKGAFIFLGEIVEPALNNINSILNYKDGYDELVAIHIRRGDYVGNPSGFPACTPEYYQTAINKFDDKNYRFVIFSDDIPYCKSIFGEDDALFYSEGNNQYMDLCMMSLCDHFIIANSSFSWWGAYLGENENKKVIGPSVWFGPSTGNNTKDLMPKEWELI
jgi:hypothetical protein